MTSIGDCLFPDELFYNVDTGIWARREADGTITVGMTSCACSMVGELVAYLPKKVGEHVERNKSLATVESGKWVGPVKAPVGGEIIAVNGAVAAKAAIINADPYGRGWVAKMKPANWDGEAAGLITGAGVRAAFEAKMKADGLSRC